MQHLFADAKVTEVVAQWPCSHGQPLREAVMIAALFSVERMQKLSSERCGKSMCSSPTAHVTQDLAQVNDRVAADVCAQSHFNTMCRLSLTDVIVDGNTPAFLRNLTWCLLSYFAATSSEDLGLNFTGKTRCGRIYWVCILIGFISKNLQWCWKHRCLYYCTWHLNYGNRLIKINWVHVLGFLLL